MTSLMDTRLDGVFMIQHRGEYVCCLLCLRQFPSEYKVRKHLAKSALHAGNLEAASRHRQEITLAVLPAEMQVMTQLVVK